MTEEINNLNTDLKELFVNDKIEESSNILDQTADETVLEISLFNYEIIKKYYDSGKFTLLIQYIRFVAFSCYLCEYAAKRQLIAKDSFDGMSFIFNEIYKLIQK